MNKALYVDYLRFDDVEQVTNLRGKKSNINWKACNAVHSEAGEEIRLT